MLHVCDPSGDDPLLVCVLALARHHGRNVASDIAQGARLVPADIAKVAERAGLAAKIVRRPLEALNGHALPCMVLLDGGSAAVLTARHNDMCEILLPERGGGESDIPVAELASLYTGYAVLAGPLPRHRDGAEIPKAGSWYWGTLALYWRDYLHVAVAAALLNVLSMAVPLFTMNVYDRVVPNNAVETLWVLAVGATLAVLFEFSLRTLRGVLLDHAGRNADVLISARIFEHVLALPLAARSGSPGAFASHLREFESLRDFFASSTLTALVDLPFVLLFLAVVWWVAGPLVWVPALAVPLIIGLGMALQMPMERLARAGQKDGARKHGLLVEALTGLETVKSLGAEGRMLRRWEEHAGHVARTGLWSRSLSALAINAALAIQSMVTIALVVWGAQLIAERALSSGGLIACTMLLGRIMAPLAQIAALLARLQQAVAAFKTLDAIMATPLERHGLAPALRRPDLKGGIELRDVSFHYPKQPQPALAGVSLKIAAGERVALVGGIGSGKSTITRLVLGLYRADQGEVLVDGLALGQIDPADLRRCFGYVSQDVMLFAGTLRDNVAFAAPWASDLMVLRAAALSGVEDFAKRHPHGLGMAVGERGEGLSGGQRQAVALARALLCDPPALILDEPTSAMDQLGEERLKQRLTRLLPGRTLLLVTHRPSLLSLVDRVVVMENGKIYADSPRDQVLAHLAQAQPAPKVVQM